MAGRKPFVPTAEQRKMVKAMAGYGIPEDDICKVITNPQTGNAIDGKTLRKHFRTELDTGFVTANAKVKENLFWIATQRHIAAPVVTAAIFWDKTRGGAVEKQRVELTGKDGGPVDQRTTVVDDNQVAEAVAKLESEY